MINSTNYLKSKWTSVKKLSGWRHFEVRNVYKKEKKLELFSVCDNKIFIIVDLKDIKDHKKWMPGWKEIV
tara:strand:- start:1290 stop:1499 length:210 start_codon:yes stop_codon:yes gene_type:complete